MADKILLRQPFPASSIKKRAGAGGKAFSYVDGEEVLSRVLEATDGEFSWSVEKIDFVSDNKASYWLCMGHLTIPGLGSRSGVGTALVANEDSAKSAETDAFKRAAVKFGVALDLYAKGDDSQQQPTQSAPRPRMEPSHRDDQFGARCEECGAPTGRPHATNCSRRQAA